MSVIWRVLRPAICWIVLSGSASLILFAQSCMRLEGHTMRAGYWFVYVGVSDYGVVGVGHLEGFASGDLLDCSFW